MPDLQTFGLEKAFDTAAHLCSVFDLVSSNGEQPKRSRNTLTACILRNDNIVNNAGDLSKEQLKRDLGVLNSLDPKAQEATMPFLLQKYGWRIGKPEGGDIQDVAFCDAIRLEQALGSHSENGYLLVKGDLSGIQNYIYGNIQQKTAGGLAKVAQRLRGRSVLVTLLTDFLANLILHELELPNWHLLFAGGGHFNLMLPNTPTTVARLQVLSKMLDDEMRRQFGDRLQLILAHVTCSEVEITKEAGLCFERLNAERERKKYQQHHEYLEQHFYPPDNKSSENKGFENRDNWEIEIGKFFPKRKIIVEAITKGPVFALGKLPVLARFTMHKHTYTLLNFEEMSDAMSEISNVVDLVSAQIFTLNDTGFLPSTNTWNTKIKQPISFGFRFMGKTVPMNENQRRPRTFEEISQNDSLEMLGAMRLDVDDLGFIFSHGIKNVTLGQIITLSREMHYFFSAHFDLLANELGLYLIYSGGDDAFVVGQWKKLIDFSRKLRRDFDLFVVGNKAIHFSAGIYLGDPHYPVGRFYRDAGRLQDEAKNANHEKDRIQIFSHVLSWSSYDSKVAFGEGLAGMLQKGDGQSSKKLTMSFAYRLLQLVRTSFYERNDEAKGQKRGGIIPNRFARNVANMRYLFARHGYDKAETEKVLNDIEKALINDFLRSFDFGNEKKTKSIRDYLVALNYALYIIRSQKNSQ